MVVFRQAQSGQATFDHVGSDLVIHGYGDDSSVTLKNYSGGENYRRYHLVFDDTSLEAGALQTVQGSRLTCRLREVSIC